MAHLLQVFQGSSSSKTIYGNSTGGVISLANFFSRGDVVSDGSSSFVKNL